MKINYKHSILVLLFLLLSTTFIWAQSGTISWLTATAREMNYPQNKYLIGFVTGNVREGESVAAAMARVKKLAQVELTEGIRVKVESESKKFDRQIQANGKYDFASLYEAYAKTTTNAEIAGVKNESCQDSDNKEIIYGFAYVDREGLSRYYQSQIKLNLSKIKDALLASSQLEQVGQKQKAKKTCEGAVEYLTKIEYAQDLLSAISVEPLDADVLQLGDASGVRQELVNRIIVLDQGVLVFVKASENNFGMPLTLLSNKLKSILAQNGCSFANDAESADYVLSIDALTRKHDGQIQGANIKFAYADITLDLKNIGKDKSVLNDEFSIKGGGISFETAGKKALEDAATSIWDKIKEWIEK